MDKNTFSFRLSKLRINKGVSARDNRDGDVTHTIIIESITAINEDHVAVVSYAAFDRSGNVGNVQVGRRKLPCRR